MGSRQAVRCTNNCGQGRDAKRAARAAHAAGLFSKHAGVRVGVRVEGGVRLSVVKSHCAVFSFTLPL